MTDKLADDEIDLEEETSAEEANKIIASIINQGTKLTPYHLNNKIAKLSTKSEKFRNLKNKSDKVSRNFLNLI